MNELVPLRPQRAPLLIYRDTAWSVEIIILIKRAVQDIRTPNIVLVLEI